MKQILLGLALVGCGSNARPQTDAGAVGTGSDGDAGIVIGDGGGTAAGDAAASGFRLTSTAFAEGGTIPTASTCAGADTSPPLMWTGAPSNAKSFALVLTDTTISLDHWVIYDIPATATSLPADVQNAFAPNNVTGAHQTQSNAVNQTGTNPEGYAGPCPQAGKGTHTYQFALYPLADVTLPGTSGMSTAQMAITQILVNNAKLGTPPATLTASFAR